MEQKRKSNKPKLYSDAHARSQSEECTGSGSFRNSFKKAGSQISPRSDSNSFIIDKDKPIAESQYKKAKRCHICETKFDLLTKRHHCRFCGNSV